MKKLALLVTASAMVMSTSAIAEDTLTIVSWGGAYTASQDNAYHKPYTAKTGVKIFNEDKSNQALAGIRAQIEAGKVTWDVVDMLQADAQRACDEGLLVQIKHNEWLAKGTDGSKALDDFFKGSTGECFIPSIIYATLFAYNNTSFPGDKPSKLEDVFDLKKFPGKRGLEKVPQKNLEWALIADGVAPEKVYEVLATKEGQDRAFKKLDTIKDNIIWWSAGAQAPQLLADKEVTITTGYNGRFFAAQVNEKQPFTIMWDRQMQEVDGWVIPAGNEKKLELIKKYLNFATDSQRLADQAKYISYGPARKSSAALVSKHLKTGVDMKPHMPTNPANMKTALIFNTQFWADYGDQLEERFNTWVAK